MPEVKFEFTASFGREIAIAGDFNDWDFNSYQLERDNEYWRIELDLETGVYNYKFLVDRQLWINDPGADLYYKENNEAINSVIDLKEDGVEVNKDYGKISELSFNNQFNKKNLLNKEKVTKNKFSTSDKQVYIYHSLSDFIGTAEISYVWCTPDLKIYEAESTLITGQGGEQRLYHYINLFKERIKPGLWKVFILVNGKLLKQEEFLLKSNSYYQKNGQVLIK